LHKLNEILDKLRENVSISTRRERQPKERKLVFVCGIFSIFLLFYFHNSTKTTEKIKKIKNGKEKRQIADKIPLLCFISLFVQQKPTNCFLTTCTRKKQNKKQRNIIFLRAVSVLFLQLNFDQLLQVVKMAQNAFRFCSFRSNSNSSSMLISFNELSCDDSASLM
jgi:hypothetical protein